MSTSTAKDGASSSPDQCVLEAMLSPLHSPPTRVGKTGTDVTDPHYLNPHCSRRDTDPARTADTETMMKLCRNQGAGAPRNVATRWILRRGSQRRSHSSSGGVGTNPVQEFQSDEPQSTQGSKSPMERQGLKHNENSSGRMNQEWAFLNSPSPRCRRARPCSHRCFKPSRSLPKPERCDAIQME